MNIYDYKNKGYVSTPTTPLRAAYKTTTYLDEQGLSGANNGSRDSAIKAKRDAEPDGASQTPLPAVRGRREMFRIESKMYENHDVDLNAEKDLSPVAVVPNGRDWITTGVMPDNHNRSVSTTSNNNGYHSEGRYDSLQGQNSNSNHMDYGENNTRNISVSSTNHDTLDRSVFGSPPPGHLMPNGDLRRGSSLSKRGHPDMNNRSILSTRNSTTVDQSVLSTRSDMNDLNKSSVSQHNDLNRSVMSGRSILTNRQGLVYRDSVNNERSFHGNGDISRITDHNGDFNRSVMSRDYEQSPEASLTRDQTKVPTHKQNGFAHPVRDTTLSQSQPNLNLSRGSVTVISPNSVPSVLLNISIVCILSLILVALALQLLFQLSGRRTSQGALPGSILSNQTYSSTAEVAIAVASVVVMLDLCCLLICAMQAVFAAKLLRCSQGHER